MASSSHPVIYWLWDVSLLSGSGHPTSKISYPYTRPSPTACKTLFSFSSKNFEGCYFTIDTPEYIIWVCYSRLWAEKCQNTRSKIILSNWIGWGQNILVEKDFRSSSFKLHCGAESKWHSAFQPKPNSFLLWLKIRKQHINPKSCKQRHVNTLYHLPHPCCGGLAHVFKACVKADGSYLIRIWCNLLLVGKKNLDCLSYKCKTWEVQPTS